MRLARRFCASVRRLSLILAGLLLAFGVDQARAGDLDKAALGAYFKDPFYIGEKEAKHPIWPLFRKNIPASDDFIGYVFESIDFAPIAGYSGTPPSMLVAITPAGDFIGVWVISHNEPIFKHGATEAQLTQFVDQYAKHKLGLKQTIRVSPTGATGQSAGNDIKWIDGVASATVSVRIINESVLASALKAARAKLGIESDSGSTGGRKLLPDSGATLAPQEIAERKYLAATEIGPEAIAKNFGKAFSKDFDPSPGTDPKAESTQAYTLYLSAPEVGRAVLGPAAYAKLAGELRDGDHAILIGTSGKYGFRGADQRKGSIPENFIVTQDGLPILINGATDVSVLAVPEFPKASNWVAIKVLKETGFDPARPFAMSLRITKKNSELFPRRETKEFPVAFQVPLEFFSEPEMPLEGWRAIWHEQRAKIALAGFAVVLLSLGLAMQKRLTSHGPGFNAFRTAYLAVTLFGLGWWGQGQLSINNVLGVINAARSSGDFSYLLFDPVSLLLWGFVIISLVLFGRGTFCGWLCPFGAFQEFVGNIARWLKVPQITVPYAIDRKLRLLKYVVLAGIIGSAFAYMPAAEWLSEIEPFKTSITLGFDRSWPFVLYAAAVLLFSAFVYKGFCLYLCPLGATLALLGRTRMLDWIPRRKECGSPCQLCAVRCSYGAIEPKGQVRYDECFQCMDCVVIHNDDKACVPLILARKGKSMPVPAKPGQPARPLKEVAV
jgi:transcriptional regulator of nitric oxide reductase